MAQLQSMYMNDFRSFLEQELARRNSVNSNYSLRAFARDLGVDSSFLSKLLSGKRSMTARTILCLAPRLSLPESQVQDFIQKANDRRRRRYYTLSSLKAQSVRELESHELPESMEWYHVAVLELVQVKGFQADGAWIAERLGITLEQAQAALADLENAKLLYRGEDGTWKRQFGNYSMSSKNNARAALVKKQIYEQALALLPEQTGTHSTVTVSVAEDRLAEANERIIKFRRELCSFLSEPEDKDHVYQLAISLFPVTK